MNKRIVIIGGSSGLGLALAKGYCAQGHTVLITGRKDPQIPELHFHRFSIDARSESLMDQLDPLLADIGLVDVLIYAAGYYQEGLIDTLSDDAILTMIHVGLTAPALLVQRLKKQLNNPVDLLFVTSSSQYTPRKLEPVYTAVKSGLGMLGASLALDPAIGKVLVLAPSGMSTPFWDSSKDTRDYLDAEWVAQQTMALFDASFDYRYAHVLRSPARIEIVDERT